MDFGRPVGLAHPPFIIASLDCKELGTYERALAAIDVAADSSVDAIKLSRMPWDWCARLYEHAANRGIAMIASAQDQSAIERLDWFGAPAFYLSFDWSDLELVARAARTGKPLVIQVGTASPYELAELIATARANGNGGIALVQSVVDLDLEGLDGLAGHGAVLGIVDRSECAAIPLAAISRGASIVEKRFTLKGTSLCTAKVSAVVRACEQAWASLGNNPQWTVN